MLTVNISRQISRIISAAEPKMQNKILNLTNSEAQMLNRSFRVSVEGNIGSGKTTLLNYFNKFPTVQIYGEPLDKWRNVQGHNLLGLLYNNMPNWSATFQSYVQLTRMQIQSSRPREGVTVQMFERSVQNNRYCFLENSFKSGLILPAQYSVLCKWYEWIEQNVDIALDLIVYLRSTPDIAYQRVLARNRNEEKGISLNYLESLHDAHEKWLYNPNLSTPVFVINANESLTNITKFYNNILPFLHKTLGKADENKIKSEKSLQVLETEML